VCEDEGLFEELLFSLFVASPTLLIALLATHWGFSFTTDIDMYIFIIGMILTVIPSCAMTIMVVGGLAGYYIEKRFGKMINGDIPKQ
jgi:hypothetical protein